jgi:hypothetical protein
MIMMFSYYLTVIDASDRDNKMELALESQVNQLGWVDYLQGQLAKVLTSIDPDDITPSPTATRSPPPAVDVNADNSTEPMVSNSSSNSSSNTPSEGRPSSNSVGESVASSSSLSSLTKLSTDLDDKRTHSFVSFPLSVSTLSRSHTTMRSVVVVVVWCVIWIWRGGWSLL